MIRIPQQSCHWEESWTVVVILSWSAQSPSFHVEVSKKHESYTDDYFMYQMRSSVESVPPLKYVSTKQVFHFDKDAACISRMRRVMKVFWHFVELRKSGNQEMLQTTGMVKQLLCCGMVFLRILCLICWLKLRCSLAALSQEQKCPFGMENLPWKLHSKGGFKHFWV